MTMRSVLPRREVVRVGRKHTVTIPAKLCQRLGISEGDLIIPEEHDGGILFRPAVAVPHEIYSKERVAEFLLNSAADAKDYARLVKRVRKLGVDPSTVPHEKPPGAKGA